LRQTFDDQRIVAVTLSEALLDLPRRCRELLLDIVSARIIRKLQEQAIEDVNVSQIPLFRSQLLPDCVKS
jgi:hypothetical protein